METNLAADPPPPQNNNDNNTGDILAKCVTGVAVFYLCCWTGAAR